MNTDDCRTLDSATYGPGRHKLRTYSDSCLDRRFYVVTDTFGAWIVPIGIVQADSWEEAYEVASDEIFPDADPSDYGTEAEQEVAIESGELRMRPNGEPTPGNGLSSPYYDSEGCNIVEFREYVANRLRAGASGEDLRFRFVMDGDPVETVADTRHTDGTLLEGTAGLTDDERDALHEHLDQWGGESCIMSCARALYWYAAHYHEGQWSDLYSLMTSLGYQPGIIERAPGERDGGDDVEALELYLALQATQQFHELGPVCGCCASAIANADTSGCEYHCSNGTGEHLATVKKELDRLEGATVTEYGPVETRPDGSYRCWVCWTATVPDRDGCAWRVVVDNRNTGKRPGEEDE